MKKGLLIINLGTPKSPSRYDVGKFLCQFLCDKRVVDLPAIFRYLLVFGVILPFRTSKTTTAYRRIWQNEGAPLLVHSRALLNVLKEKLQDQYMVQLAVRYGEPTLQDALKALAHCEEVTVLPLYPQYASASTGSSIEATLNLIQQQSSIPSLKIIHAFYQHPAYIQVQAALIQPYLSEHDFTLFSYHGLPARQVLQGGCQNICQGPCLPPFSTKCYRSQCYETSSLIATQLKLSASQYTTCFQSRLGRAQWIQPYTEMHLPQLAHQGIKRVLVACPSFTADCLETLDEIQYLLKQSWLQLGGEKLTLVPCLNSHPQWADAIVKMIQ